MHFAIQKHSPLFKKERFRQAALSFDRTTQILRSCGCGFAALLHQARQGDRLIVLLFVFRQKNIYYQVKGAQCESIKIQKCAELGYARPVDELKDQDEEEDIVVKNAGLCAALLK